MSESEITALAREYAEEKGRRMEREQSLPNCLIKEVMEMDAEELTKFLQWLLRRFCIVEKSKATELCRLTLEHGDSEDYGLIDGLTDIVCEIFPEQYHQVANKPEIAKEVKR